MSAKVKTRCPVCAARYYVPTTAVGHRAHCSGCDSVFRVTLSESSGRNGLTGSTPAITISSGAAEISKPPGVNGRKHPPTEEDIVRWLNEADEADDVAVRPRVIADQIKPAVAATSEQRPGVLPSETPLQMPAHPCPTARDLATPAQSVQRRAAG